MKKIIMTLVLLGTLINFTNAQTNECIKDFDFLVKKIKVDYPGYSNKVTAKTAPELLNLEQELRKKIQLYPDSCRKYLSTYADWFKDHHLRIAGLGFKSNDANPKIERYWRVLNEDTLNILQSKKTSPEGMWRSFFGEIAIVKSANAKEYIGVSVSFRNYEKNQIVFKLLNEHLGEYTLITYSNQYQPTMGKASIWLNDNILELHDDKRLVRKTSSDTYDNALLYSYIPEFPNGSNTI